MQIEDVQLVKQIVFENYGGTVDFIIIKVLSVYTQSMSARQVAKSTFFMKSLVQSFS